MPVNKIRRKKSKKTSTNKKSSSSQNNKQKQLKIPDRRSIEQFLSTLSNTNQENSLAQAQDLLYEAWDTEVKRKRIELAHKALKISPLCADAYVLLAEEQSKTVEEARILFARGVEAGELALSPQAFKEDQGLFWGILETRPYMRAREGLAQALWILGEREEATTHFFEMLKLNPNDNQGVRYMLATWLLELDDRATLKRLLDTYEDDIDASWKYTETLLSFRETGSSQQTQTLLQEAWESNHHVPKYLTQAKRIPKTSPEYITFGGEDQAIAYTQENLHLWTSTPGAIAWIAEVTKTFQVPAKRRVSS